MGRFHLDVLLSLLVPVTNQYTWDVSGLDAPPPHLAVWVLHGSRHSAGSCLFTLVCFYLFISLCTMQGAVSSQLSEIFLPQNFQWKTRRPLSTGYFPLLE